MRLTLKMDRGVLVLLFPIKKKNRSFYLFPPSNAHLSFKTAKKRQIYECNFRTLLVERPNTSTGQNTIFEKLKYVRLYFLERNEFVKQSVHCTVYNENEK